MTAELSWLIGSDRRCLFADTCIANGKPVGSSHVGGLSVCVRLQWLTIDVNNVPHTVR
jgi:hypothetical protein